MVNFFYIGFSVVMMYMSVHCFTKAYTTDQRERRIRNEAQRLFSVGFPATFFNSLDTDRRNFRNLGWFASCMSWLFMWANVTWL